MNWFEDTVSVFGAMIGIENLAQHQPDGLTLPYRDALLTIEACGDQDTREVLVSLARPIEYGMDEAVCRSLGQAYFLNIRTWHIQVGLRQSNHQIWLLAMVRMNPLVFTPPGISQVAEGLDRFLRRAMVLEAFHA